MKHLWRGFIALLSGSTWIVAFGSLALCLFRYSAVGDVIFAASLGAAILLPILVAIESWVLSAIPRH